MVKGSITHYCETEKWSILRFSPQERIERSLSWITYSNQAVKYDYEIEQKQLIRNKAKTNCGCNVIVMDICDDIDNKVFATGRQKQMKKTLSCMMYSNQAVN